MEENKKTLRERLNELSDKAKIELMRAVEWTKAHKEAIIVFGPVIMGGIVEIAKIQTKVHVTNEERALKERFIYDRSTGHYYELRRKPKTSEWLQIEQRKQNGETLGWILNDMRLLK